MVLLRMLAFRPAQAQAQAVRTTVAGRDAYQQPATPTPEPAAKEQPRPVQPPPETAAAAKAAHGRGNRLSQDWRQILEGLAVSGMVKQLAANCVMLEKQGNTNRLGLNAGHKQLMSPKAEKRLQQALGEYFDANIRLEIETGTVNSHETPAQAVAREKDERQQQAEKSIEEDGFVQAMKETFNAEVIPGSVRPTAEDK